MMEVPALPLREVNFRQDLQDKFKAYRMQVTCNVGSGGIRCFFISLE